MLDDIRPGVLVQLERELTTIDGIILVPGTMLRVNYITEKFISLGCPGLEDVPYVVRPPNAGSFSVVQCV